MLALIRGSVLLDHFSKCWQIVAAVASWRKEWGLQTQPSFLHSSFMQIWVVDHKWLLSNPGPRGPGSSVYSRVPGLFGMLTLTEGSYAVKQEKEGWGWGVCSFAVCSHRPWLTCVGNKRRSTQTNVFSKSFISALLPQMFQCNSAYHLFITNVLFICYKHCSRYRKEISMFS